MKIKFTKASKKDKTLVTVRLAQLDTGPDVNWLVGIEKNEQITLVVEGIHVVFVVNRINESGIPVSATTHCFPRFLRLPQVGRPVFADVTEVY